MIWTQTTGSLDLSRNRLVPRLASEKLPGDGREDRKRLSAGGYTVHSVISLVTREATFLDIVALAKC